MRLGETKYTPTAGTRTLQDAIIAYYEREFGAHFDKTEVMATSGGKTAIFNAIVSLVSTGDEVLIVKPYWVTFPELVTFARDARFHRDGGNGVCFDRRTGRARYHTAHQVDYSQLAEQSDGALDSARRVSANHGSSDEARRLCDYGRMLFAIRLSTG
jgi:hypothetical protein